jgi:hypothetical protein
VIQIPGIRTWYFGWPLFSLLKTIQRKAEIWNGTKLGLDNIIQMPGLIFAPLYSSEHKDLSTWVEFSVTWIQYSSDWLRTSNKDVKSIFSCLITLCIFPVSSFFIIKIFIRITYTLSPCLFLWIKEIQPNFFTFLYIS